MASTRTHSLSAPVGPVGHDIECGHGQGGFVLASDPDVSLVGSCNRPAVARVPGPGPNLGAVTVCPYHLARYLADVPEDVATSVRERFDPDRFTPDHTLLDLADAPPTVDHRGTRYRRLGLDQAGRVHYYSDAGHDVQVRDAVGTIEHTEGLGPRSLNAWVRFVADRRGWVALEDAPATGGDRA
ncbi:hypothetical protein ACFQH6_19570 [Halobacteriaceae archaeon GCM10025711]